MSELSAEARAKIKPGGINLFHLCVKFADSKKSELSVDYEA